MWSDNDLRSDVIAELQCDPSVDATEIGVSVKDGIVSLSGHVPSYSQKWTAEKAAKRVFGVKGVADELDVHLPSSTQRTDAEIAQAALHALKWYSTVPDDRLKVTVDHGWMTLEGNLDWQYQKDDAETAVRYLTGVKGLTNSVTVTPRVKPEEVKEKIKSAFERNADLDARRIAWLRFTCGQCRYCRAGSENLCPQSRFTGYHENGGYADYAVVREDFAYALPAALDPVAATPLLCAGIIGYRALKRAEVRPGCRLGLYGFGSSAHIAIQVARHWGCSIYVMTRDAQHQSLAKELGAAWAGAADAKPPELLDSAILFAPVGELVLAALEALDMGGTLAVAGIYLTDIPTLKYERHIFHEKSLRSVTANTRQDGEELLKLAAEIPLAPHTTPFPLADANRALRTLKEDAIQGSGVLVVSDPL